MGGDYDSPHEKLRQEYQILLGRNNRILREMPAYTVGQLFHMADGYRRKHGIDLTEVREEDHGIHVLILEGGEMDGPQAAAVGIDDHAHVDDLDVHLVDDRKLGRGA